MKKTFLALIIATLLIPSLCYAQTQATQQNPPPDVIKKLGGYKIYPANPNTIHPGQIVAEIKPGDQYEDSFMLNNTTDHEIKLVLYPSDSKTVDGTYTMKVDYEPQENVGKWTTFEEKEVILQPKEKHQVKFTMVIPPDAKSDDYKGGFSAVQYQEPPKDKGGVVYSTRIVMTVNLKVTNNPQPVPKASQSDLLTSVLSGTNTPYFWGSLGVFLLGIAYFIYGTIRERKKKKQSSM
jgi:hypothetical protein